MLTDPGFCLQSSCPSLVIATVAEDHFNRRDKTLVVPGKNRFLEETQVPEHEDYGAHFFELE